jgi:uncharacterized protein YndB with AHSA1/START domain
MLTEIVRTARGPQLRLGRDCPEPIGDVWAALTEPEHLAAWFAPLTLSGRTGRLDFDGGYAEITVLACATPHRIELDWAFDDGEPTHLLVTLSGNTTVLLEHTFPADPDPVSLAGPACGWQHHLDALAAHVAGTPAPNWDDYYPALMDEWRARAG